MSRLVTHGTGFVSLEITTSKEGYARPLGTSTHVSVGYGHTVPFKSALVRAETTSRLYSSSDITL